jgi:anti-sigma factor RsiW
VNCWRVQNLIAPFLDDELPDSESSSLADHLERCTPCRELVENVAALPDFPRLELDAEAECALWAEFDRCLASRIAESLETPMRVSDGARPEYRDLRVPRSLAAAAAAVVVMLAGWNWMTYERLDRLEASLNERDAIITALQERVAEHRDANSAFAVAGSLGELPVLLPPSAPGAIVIGSTLLPAYRRGGYQLAASSPTLVR